VQWNGEYVDPPEPVSWFPEKLAWSMKTPKQVIRKFPPFASFQKFLVSETGVGNISRQEVVSMIPPLLMDIKPGMTVLDMCAAPGSKSAQLIEMVHQAEEARVRKVMHDIEKEQNRPSSPDGVEVEKAEKLDQDSEAWADDGRATGLLIANDAEYRRAQMLVHQVKRLNSPNLLVTNHDASQFPSIRIPSPNKHARYLKFDRILADVPCSGDGTARKNYNVWKDWTPGNGIGLHSLQVRILVRAIQMLKVGGRAVYSTCSLNPVENEAVVATAVDMCGGKDRVQIVDCTKELPGLKRAPGLSSWPVMDKTGRLWKSWGEVQDALNEGYMPDRETLTKLSETMFPTKKQGIDELHLDRCMRVYPHFQDTGGFFITVLEKLSEIRYNGAKSKKDQIADDRSSTILGDDVQMEEIKTPQGTGVDSDTKANGHFEIPSELTGIETTNLALLAEENEDSESKKRTADPELTEERPSKTTKSEPQLDAPTAAGKATMPSGKRQNAPQEEFYKYLPETHPVLQDIFAFYNLSPRFPRDRYMVRNVSGDPVKAIYYTSVLVRDILIHNEGRGIKFIQAGVKMFMKQDAQGQDICRWRIQSEGIPILDPWVGEERVVRLRSRSTMMKLLKEMFIKVSNGAHEEIGEIGERVRDISMGCAVLRVESSEGEGGFRERMVMPLWRSLHSANVMLPKEDRK
jgi:multisite-specific tRNA:(cytosine-C5)-methyltransferase